MRWVWWKRKAPAELPKVRAWRKHVEGVARELENMSAPPPWWNRLWASLRADLSLAEPAPLERLAGPSIPAQHEHRCDHLDATSTTLGALIRRPKVRDAALLGVEAMHCKRCGMTVAVFK